MFSLLLSTLLLLVLSGLLSLYPARSRLWRRWIGAGGASLACLIGLGATGMLLWEGQSVSWQLPWPLFMGTVHLGMDSLSAFFLVPTLAVAGLAACYGVAYLQPYEDQPATAHSWFFYNLLVASLILVCLARDGMSFLMAWEGMALSSFFLVTFEDQTQTNREAGQIYLLSSRLGAAFLLFLFIYLAQQAGSFAFARLGPQTLLSADLVFGLALIGFGAKAGLVPFHVWLPEAHPAAPSHVSALMSGIMIKSGIYGLLRILTFLDQPPAWWGWVLIGLGLLSSLAGILLALAQHRLKRLLAYSSVENIGLITIGIGIGLLGISSGSAGLAVLGFSSSLFHLFNHALFKSLLFLGAGALVQATHSDELDQLGGLWKTMPWSSLMLLTGAIAIVGLPPLNGFASEFLLYLAALQAPFLAIIPVGVALTGGLALICFVKVVGIGLLGQPRSPAAAQAREVPWGMRLAMAPLAGGCLLAAGLAPFFIQALTPILVLLMPFSPAEIQGVLASATESLFPVVTCTLAGLALTGVLLFLRLGLLRQRSVAQAETWGCGYQQPTPRMQYTGSSFVQPVTALFNRLLQIRRSGPGPRGLFPAPAAFATQTPDRFLRQLYLPLDSGLKWIALHLRWIQHGNLQIYVLYIAFTLLALLAWGGR